MRLGAGEEAGGWMVATYVGNFYRLESLAYSILHRGELSHLSSVI